jgi:hypothetical protein
LLLIGLSERIHRQIDAEFAVDYAPRRYILLYPTPGIGRDDRRPQLREHRCRKLAESDGNFDADGFVAANEGAAHSQTGSTRHDHRVIYVKARLVDRGDPAEIHSVDRGARLAVWDIGMAVSRGYRYLERSQTIIGAANGIDAPGDRGICTCNRDH